MSSPLVLVVEDNEMNMELITDVLELAGWKVLPATDADKGLRLAAEHLPDIILMDIQLPGIDGLEATRLLKDNPVTSAIPVVVVTSHAMKGERERADEAGCQGYFSKPINVSTLVDNLRRLLPEGK
ncbi:MAG: response regulator [Candidatus Glassbacteria bacterium]